MNATPAEESPDPMQRRTQRETQHTDEELLELARGGDALAFGELWTRHKTHALWTARRVTRRFDAEDLVSEAYLRIMSSIRRGYGPRASFRAYLRATIRSIAVNWARVPVEQTAVETYVFEQAEPVGAAGAAVALDVFERNEVLQAFRSLPEQWQTVLWLSEVEGLKMAQIAKMLDLTPNAAAALAYRARSGLRRSWQDAVDQAV